MSALFMDGYDHYGTGLISRTNMLAGPYTSIASVVCATPPWGAARTGTYCLRSDTGANSGARHAVASPGTHFFVSLGYAVDSLSFVPTRVIDFMDGSALTIVQIIPTTTGALEVRAGDGTLLGATAGPVITAENWHFFEIEVNTSAHTLIMRVDDPAASLTPTLSISNSLITGTIAQVGVLTVANGFSGGISNVDDLFIRSSAGSVNNSWLGDRRIATLLADADTPTAGWTPNYYQKLGAGILDNTVTNASVFAATSTQLDIGAADFTIEGFVRFQALPTGSNKATIFSRWDEAANQRSYQLFLGSVALNSGSLCFQSSTDGTVSTVTQSIVYPWTPDLDRWYNITIVRASGQLLLFVDGQQLGLPIADSSTYFVGTARFGLGAQALSTFPPTTDNTSVQGWFDEVRFTNGYARYTTNFTPTAVEFPRNIGGDPHWADVVLLAGFDSTVQDESGFARVLTPWNGSAQFTPNDGPLVGTWSTVGKAVPDDNTFISAPYVPATSILTLTVNATNNNTATVGTTDGSTPAVYTFKTSLTGSAFEVKIGASIQATLQNFYNAINAGAGSGTAYGTGTTANWDVNASQLPAGQMMVSANIAGTAGNAIATSKTGLTGGWTSTTLAGGLDIPGPTNYKLQRLPPTTTIVSAIQVAVRASKSDAGLGSINSALVGPLGGVGTSATHNLTISPNYYNDIHEVDPDTSGPISPTTISGGSIEINRDT